jgi:uncharacterized membrane protein (UPF0127 family)
MVRIPTILLLLLLCGCGEKPTTLDEFQTQEVTLPNGKHIRAEVMMKQEDMMRGMMFRDTLAADHGMLFLHGGPGNYPYWMYQVRVPLDIIWMDLNHNVVEISPETPPCKSSSARQCPNYGGHAKAIFVLELPGGAAAKNGVKVGERIGF